MCIWFLNLNPCTLNHNTSLILTFFFNDTRVCHICCFKMTSDLFIFCSKYVPFGSLLVIFFSIVWFISLRFFLWYWRYYNQSFDVLLMSFFFLSSLISSNMQPIFIFLFMLLFLIAINYKCCVWQSWHVQTILFHRLFFRSCYFTKIYRKTC